jgi:hypothetical protein
MGGGGLNRFPIITSVHWKVDKMIIFSYNTSICLFFVKIDTHNTHLNERSLCWSGIRPFNKDKKVSIDSIK